MQLGTESTPHGCIPFLLPPTSSPANVYGPFPITSVLASPFVSMEKILSKAMEITQHKKLYNNPPSPLHPTQTSCHLHRSDYY